MNKVSISRECENRYCMNGFVTHHYPELNVDYCPQCHPEKFPQLAELEQALGESENGRKTV